MPSQKPCLGPWTTALRWVTGLYTLTLVTLTHIPAEQTPPVAVSDKLLHLLAYLALSWLVCATWSTRRDLTGRDISKVIGALVVFAALDELLQIPVGRHCDIMDWLADAAGVVGGAVAYLATRRWVDRALSGQKNPHP